MTPAPPCAVRPMIAVRVNTHRLPARVGRRRQGRPLQPARRPKSAPHGPTTRPLAARSRSIAPGRYSVQPIAACRRRPAPLHPPRLRQFPMGGPRVTLWARCHRASKSGGQHRLDDVKRATHDGPLALGIIVVVDCIYLPMDRVGFLALRLERTLHFHSNERTKV